MHVWIADAAHSASCLAVHTVCLIAQLVKNPPAMQETQVQFLGREDPLEKRKATHASILAWRIPWTAYSMESQSRTQLSDFHFLIL